MPRHVRTTGTANRRHPLNRGRVSWWLTLPHLSGTGRWFDIVGNNHGTLTSMANANNGWRPTYRPGGWGAVQFDGSAAYVASSTTYAGNFTLAAWFRASVVNGSYQCLMGKGGPSGLMEGKLYLWSNNALCVYTGSASALVGNTVITAGVWHRVYAVVSGGSSCFMYLDGRLDVAGSVSSGSSPYSFQIGKDPAGADQYFGGQVDDVSIWSRALSAAEVKADYDLSRRGYPGVLNFRDAKVGRRASNLFRRNLDLRAGSRGPTLAA